MLSGEETRLRHPNDPCPRCHEPLATLTLLTSMVRYYRCGGCGRSWQVLRNHEWFSGGAASPDATDAVTAPLSR